MTSAPPCPLTHPRPVDLAVGPREHDRAGQECCLSVPWVVVRLLCTPLSASASFGGIVFFIPAKGFGIQKGTGVRLDQRASSLENGFLILSVLAIQLDCPVQSLPQGLLWLPVVHGIKSQT